MAVTTSRQKHYRDHLQEWLTIERMLTGEDVQVELLPGSYEPSSAFQARTALADFRPYTRDLVARLSGRLWTRADEIERTVPFDEAWFETAGRPRDDMGAGGGRAYDTMLMQMTELLLAYDEIWVLVDPRTQKITIIEPQYVTRWNPQSVVVKSEQSTVADVSRSEILQDVYTVYRPDSFTVVAQAEDGDGEEIRDEGMYDEQGRAFTARDGVTAVPPITRIRVPFSTRYGWTVAKAHRALYRMESRYDAAIGDALRGLLQLAVGNDTEMTDKIRDAISAGAVGIPYSKDLGEHKPLSIGTAGLPFASEALERKRTELYRVASSAEDQMNRQAQTATEAVLQDLDGSAAQVGVLAATIESAEYDILRLVAQALDARLTTGMPEDAVQVSWPRNYGGMAVDQPGEVAAD